MRRVRVAIALFIVLLPGAMLMPVWRLGGLGAGEDDVLYYYPSRVFLHETVNAGHAPWLNPWTGLGRPYAADPQSALGYPPTWLFVLLQPLSAYGLLLWMHYSFALWGGYRLGRSLGFARLAALFTGVAFAFSGFMLAHRAHFTLQNAAAWTPWAFFFMHRYLAAPHHARRGPRLAAVAVVLALQCFAGHVQAAALTALGTLVWGLAAAWPRGRDARLTTALRWLLAWICAAGVFAVQWLPTLAYAARCTRMQRGYLDFVENSWFPSSVLTFLLPMHFGQRTPNFFAEEWWGPSHQVEQFAYAGLLPLLLAFAGCYAWRGDARRRPWVVLGVFGLLLALGLFGPVCPLLYWFPGSSVFRCPARGLLLVNLALAILAGATLDDLGPRLSVGRVRLRARLLRWTRRPFVTGLMLIAVPVLLVAALTPLLPADVQQAALRAVRPWNPAVWVPLLLALLSLVTLAVVVRRWQQPRWRGLLLLVTLVDLATIGWTLDVPAGWPQARDRLVPSPSSTWMRTVAESGQRLWVVTARDEHTPGEYRQPLDKAVANTNMLRGIPTLTHYGPLQPRHFVERFSMHPWGESRDVAALLANTRWMRLCNVGWILLCDSQAPAPEGCDLHKVTRAGWRLYRHPAARGVAFFEDPAMLGAVRTECLGPSCYRTIADTWYPGAAEGERPRSGQSAWLVLSHLVLPGWVATVHDQPVRIEAVDGLVLGVEVPRGHTVTLEWRYFPPGLWVGATISFLSVVSLATLVLGSTGRRQSPARP